VVVCVVAPVEVVAVTEVDVLVLTVLGDEEHAPASTARATTHPAIAARGRGIRRSCEGDRFTRVRMRFVMTLTTGASPVRFTEAGAGVCGRREVTLLAAVSGELAVPGAV